MTMGWECERCGKRTRELLFPNKPGEPEKTGFRACYDAAQCPEEIEPKNSLRGEDKSDNVDHPSHYTQGGIECIDAIRAALTPEEFRGMCKGNALKYIWRERHKGGIEDLKKARWYLGKIIEIEGSGEAGR